LFVFIFRSLLVLTFNQECVPQSNFLFNLIVHFACFTDTFMAESWPVFW